MQQLFSSPSKLHAVVPAGDGFLLHSEVGFRLWRERVSEPMLYASAIVPNTISATDKEATFAVSATEWKRVMFSDGSVKALPSREPFVCHANGVVGLRSGVQWSDETLHAVPALASASKAHLAVLPRDRVVVLTSDETHAPCVFTVVDKANGVIGEWRTSMRWPTCVHGWAGGVLCDYEVLAWEQNKFTVAGTLPSADFVMVRDEFALEFRSVTAKTVICTMRSLHTGTVSRRIKLKSKAVRIGATTDSGFVLGGAQEAIFSHFNFQPVLLSELCAPRPPTPPQSKLWTLVESMNEQLPLVSEENEKRLMILTESAPKRQKFMRELSSAVKNGATMSQGMLHVIENGRMISAAESLIADDLPEEARIAILSRFPFLIFPMLRGQYGREAMRNALRKLAPESIAEILERIQTLLTAYQSCSVRMSSAIAVPSYSQTLSFLDLFLDARLLDLAVVCPNSLLAIRDLVNKELSAHIQVERLQGTITAQLATPMEHVVKESIEIWQLPF